MVFKVLYKVVRLFSRCMSLICDFQEFLLAWKNYLTVRARRAFYRFETAKSWFAEKLYQRRGRLARPFSHFGMASLVALGIVLAPVIAQNLPADLAGRQDGRGGPAVLSAADVAEVETATLISDKPRAEVVEYKVKSGDTISGIASKFGVSIDTIRWENNLTSIEAIKPGTALLILPETGIRHKKVQPGETIYSIAKKYSVDSQVVITWPYNPFANDETFALLVGQELFIPGGMKPKERPWAPGAYVAQKTPDAGTISATGQFIWPASGSMAQYYRWYHQGIDIANKAAPPILAADAGLVTIAGWPDNIGYGNRVLIDHGNGFQTLYAHLSRIFVSSGQTVKRGDQIGQMGSTGRSSGVHLHFEIRQNGAAVDPLGYLK